MVSLPTFGMKEQWEDKGDILLQVFIGEISQEASRSLVNISIILYEEDNQQ